MPKGAHLKSPLTLEQRFFAKVQKTETCWVWTGAKSGGYGWFTYENYKGTSAHRYAYFLKHGAFPKGGHLDHVCRNRLCVNLAHLEHVTHKENVLRGFGPPARNARKTHCIRGHEFTPENTYSRREGTRRCRECMKLYNRNLLEAV